MSEPYINVTSVTYAIKARDLLLRHGIRSSIGRTPGHVDQNGCGYSVFIRGNRQAAEEILWENGIKILPGGDSR